MVLGPTNMDHVIFKLILYHSLLQIKVNTENGRAENGESDRLVHFQEPKEQDADATAPEQENQVNEKGDEVKA